MIVLALLTSGGWTTLFRIKLSRDKGDEGESRDEDRRPHD
jgi:hypothetical protein